MIRAHILALPIVGVTRRAGITWLLTTSLVLTGLREASGQGPDAAGAARLVDQAIGLYQRGDTGSYHLTGGLWQQLARTARELHLIGSAGRLTPAR